ILSFLVKVFQLGIRKDEVYSLIKGTTLFIFKNQLDIDRSSSFFPCVAVGRSPNTRLAWCYGDLGIACSLQQVALNTRDHELNLFVKKLLLNAASIKNPQLTLVRDGG